MSTIIKAEGLGKKYILTHQQRQPYYALRDVMADTARKWGNKVLHPFTSHPSRFAGSADEEFWALKDVSFEIEQGDRVGIVGRNGAGKSTLLKVLSRIVEPTRGSVGIRGRVASLLEVGTGFHPELTGRENIFLNGAILGMTKSEIKRKFDEIVYFAEVEKFLDTPVKRYSSGMYVRLAFAVAAHLEPEVLLIDEVLAVGDVPFQKKCLGKMEDVSTQEGRTILFVSHNMGAVKHLCNRGILLSKGEISFAGNVNETINRYETSWHDTFGDHDLPPGVIYLNADVLHDRYVVQQITLINDRNEPVTKINTFDSFKFKIVFNSPDEKKNGSVAIFLKTVSNYTLLRCAMMPDSGFHMSFKKGINQVIFSIEKIPLPAGNYILAVGLSEPPVKWLYEKELCNFDIGITDVFNCGFPPQEKYTVIAAKYSWEVV